MSTYVLSRTDVDFSIPFASLSPVEMTREAAASLEMTRETLLRFSRNDKRNRHFAPVEMTRKTLLRYT